MAPWIWPWIWVMVRSDLPQCHAIFLRLKIKLTDPKIVSCECHRYILRNYDPLRFSHSISMYHSLASFTLAIKCSEQIIIRPNKTELECYARYKTPLRMRSSDQKETKLVVWNMGREEKVYDIAPRYLMRVKQYAIIETRWAFNGRASSPPAMHYFVNMCLFHWKEKLQIVATLRYLAGAKDTNCGNCGK